MEKLFDGNINTKMCTLNGFPLRIAWQMEKPIVLKKYTLTTANDSAAYHIEIQKYGIYMAQIMELHGHKLIL